MVKLKDLLNEGKYTVYFDVGSPGLMSKTVSAKNEKEAAKQVASGLKGGAKLIKKVVAEAVYQFKGYTNSKMDELDAMLSRAGIQGTPDFNKMTYTTSGKQSPAVINKIMKKLGGKKIRESVKEADLGLTYKRGKTVKVKHKKSGKTLVIVDKPVVRKEYEKIGYFAESVNEAPGKNRKDQYYGQAMVKVEPYTYKNQKRNFHDVSMYRDHKKPYNYYLSIRLAHTNPPKIDMIVDTGTHILKKAGKWAQGWIKRRMSGTGQERFS